MNLPAEQSLDGRIRVEVVVRSRPQVTLDQPDSHTNAGNIVTGGEMMLTTISVHREMRDGAAPTVVSRLVEEAIAAVLETRTHLEVVRGNVDVDYLMTVLIRSHGLSNRLEDGDPIFFMNGRAELYSEPQHRRIWRSCQRARESLAPGAGRSGIHGPIVSDFEALDRMVSVDFSAEFESLSIEMAEDLVQGLLAGQPADED